MMHTAQVNCQGAQAEVCMKPLRPAISPCMAGLHSGS